MPGLWMAAVQQATAQGSKQVNPFSNSKRNLTALGHRLTTRVRNMFRHAPVAAAADVANSRTLLDKLGLGAAVDHIAGTQRRDWRRRDRAATRRRNLRAKARDRARSHGIHYGNRLGQYDQYVCRVGDYWRAAPGGAQ